MNIAQAKDLVSDTFIHSFNKDQFRHFIKELLNRYDESKSSSWTKQYIPDAFKEHVERYERLGTFTASGGEKVDVLIVYLTHESKLERTRTALRNFVAHHLKNRDDKDAGLVAFVSPSEQTWRFSLVRMEYVTSVSDAGRVAASTSLTPARRYSYLVGEGESCHTAQSRFLSLLQDTTRDPSIEQLVEAFSVETVTREFYGAYYNLFLAVDKGLEKLGKKDEAIRREFRDKKVSTADFAKKLLGQIVFLYFIQKKGWLGVARGKEWGTGPKDFLRRMAKGEYGTYTNFFNDRLELLFYDTLATDRGGEAWCRLFKCRVPFLNGGLFEPLCDYDWEGTDIVLPNELFTNDDRTSSGDIGSGILDVFDRYNFTVNESEPLEQEVAIDPEMLGKVFENLIEENLRHGLGAYYTPREIVHYMCQESLISYLYRETNTVDVPLVSSPAVQEGFFEKPKAVQGVLGAAAHQERISRADLSTFIRSGEQAAHYEAARKSGTVSYRAQLPKAIEKHAELLDVALRDITICDPAIGSGAFPVGMMSEIVKARLSLTPYYADDAERTPYHFKRQAIQNCLYGVDIDRGAVEIAKLRLWLSLVVDEEELKHIKPLPNLDFKIVSGNSLLGFPFQSHGLNEIENLKIQYFDEPNHDRKAKLKEKIDQRIAAHLASSEKALGYEVDFDFRLFFSEVFRRRGGFDVVLANPPYVRQEDIKELKPFLKTYACFSGTADLYVYFYERGFELLRSGGTLCFISSNKYFRAGYGVKLREYLTSKGQVSELIDFGDAPIFDAIAYPSIIVVQKPISGPPSHEGALVAFSWKAGDSLQDLPSIIAAEGFALTQRELVSNGWKLASQSVLRLLERVRSVGEPLAHLFAAGQYRGILTGLNEAYVVDRETKARLIVEDPSSERLLEPFLRGRDVKRWVVKFADRYLIRIESSENVQHPWSDKTGEKAEEIFARTYPAIHAHFEGFRKALIKRGDKGRFFWELRSCAYWNDFATPKLIYPDIYEHQSVAVDTEAYLAANTCYFIPTTQIWLAALLNSTVIEWYYSSVSNKVRGGYLRAFTDYMRQIPVPSVSLDQRALIERLVFYAVWATRHLSSEGDLKVASMFEQVLNGLFYEVFFESEMHAQKLFIFKHLAESSPVDIARLSEQRRLGAIMEYYQKISDLNHPIRSCLFSLRSLEVVRIIEGE